MYHTTLTCFSNQKHAIPIYVVFESQWADWLQAQTPTLQTWAALNDWQHKKNQALLWQSAEGSLQQVMIILTHASEWLNLGILPTQLPEGCYTFVDLNPSLLFNAYLAWGLGAYQFTRYRTIKPYATHLIWNEAVTQTELIPLLEAIYLTRDLINTPAEDMMPEAFAAIAEQIAARFQASFHQVTGAALAKHYPCVAAVGKASIHPPRLLELRWGDATHRKVTLIGKGVCFDSGGLNLKNATGMALMKKDMGGAAHVLALAQLIMTQQLPIALRVLIPLVDNAISGAAYRPGDVLTSRSGKTIEVTNTDAEGRLILCDALTAAAEESPECLIDFSTLTGAARIAVGPEIAAFFSNDESLAEQILNLSAQINDPCWRLPLYQPYQSLLESSIADLNNSPDTSYAGAITAALFLQNFVPNTIPWLHFDMMAFNLKAAPGKPKGGEAMGLRVIDQWLKNKFT